MYVESLPETPSKEPESSEIEGTLQHLLRGRIKVIHKVEAHERHRRATLLVYEHVPGSWNIYL